MATRIPFRRPFLAGCAWAALAGAAQAAPTTYVHPNAPNCGGPSPCYATLPAAIQNVDNNGSVVVLASLASNVFQTSGKTGITVRGNTAGITLSGGWNVQGAAMSGWTIRDLTITSGILIQNVAVSLTIANVSLTGPGIQVGPLSQDTSANITVSGVSFPSASQSVSILGAPGVDIGGTINVSGLVNAVGVNVFSRATAGNPAHITAAVTIAGSQISQGAGIVVDSDGTGGVGHITGSIQFLNNVSSLTVGGLAVIVVGGATGDISGPVVMTGNRGHALVINTLEAAGGALGSLRLENNEVEAIEIASHNAPLVGPVTVRGNVITDQGSPEPDAPKIQVDGEPLLGQVTIENNTGGGGVISTTSFLGGYAGLLRIHNNACRSVAIDARGGAISQPITVTNNSTPALPSPDSLLVIRAQAGGTMAGGTVSGNVLDGLLLDITGSLSGNLAVSSNTFREQTTLNSVAVGPGTLTLTGNNLNGQTAVVGIRTVARFNRIFNSAAFSVNSAVDARYNWWGCNGGPGAAGCTPRPGSGTTAPWLVFTPQTRCTSPTSVTQLLDLRTASDLAVPPGNLTPAVAVVTSTQGTVSPGTQGILGAATAIVTLPAGATPTITSQIDNAAVSWPARCDPDLSGVALFAPANATFRLRNRHSSGPEDAAFTYGAAGLTPLMGDWDGNGTETPGLYDPAASSFLLRNSNTAGFADLTLTFGPGGAGWVPLAGDWNGDGTATVGLYAPSTSTFHLRNLNTSGPADLTFTFESGGAGWVPLVGDWDGDGVDTVGLYIPGSSEFRLRNSLTAGPPHLTFVFGPAGAGWRPLAGDWNGDGATTVGLYAPSTSAFSLRNSNSAGGADLTFTFGQPGAGWLPLAGDFDGPRLMTPTLSVADLVVTEGSGGGSTASFSVRLSPTSGGTVTVNYATANGTAGAGGDYTAASGTLTFTPGQASRTVAVALNDDTTPEPHETFFLNLSAPAGAVLPDGQAVATILDDDEASYFTLPPCRLADTRGAAGPSGGPALAAGSARSFPVTGLCGVPSTARVVAVNVTAVGGTQAGNFRLYPAGGAVPLASALNFRAGRARANNAIVLLGTGGGLAVQADMPSGSVHVVLDVVGYFQ